MKKAEAMAKRDGKHLIVAVQAYPMTNSLEVQVDYQSDALKILTTSCSSEWVFRNLPAGLVYDGEEYAKTSWSSDTNRAVYRNDRPVARAVKP